MKNKNFKEDNPALAFITNPAGKDKEPQQAILDAIDPISNKISNLLAEKEEPRSKRLNLLIKPTSFAKLKEYARKNSTSVNNVINILIDDLVSKGV